MRFIGYALVFVCIGLLSCKMDGRELHTEKQEFSDLVHTRIDTVFVEKIVIDTFYIKTGNCDSLKRVVSELNDKLFVSNYKIERVRYYLNIAINNPSQDKFLKGWVRRAIE